MDKKPKNLNPPHCYKSGDGWIVDFTFRGERYRKPIGPVSRSIAAEKARNARTHVAEGRLTVNGKRWNGTDWIEDHTAKITDPIFETALEQYLAWYAIERPKSYVLSTYNAKPLRAFFGKYRLSQISPFLIDKYKIERRKVCACLKPKRENPKSLRCGACGLRFDCLANSTCNHELQQLRHFYNYAVKRKLTATTVTITLFKEDNGRSRYLTQEEAERLLRACNEDFRPVVLTAMHTGCRRAELKSLLWTNVDMVHRSITVQSCYAKNGETRTMPMSDEVFAAFQRLRTEREVKPDDHLFISRYGQPWKSWGTAFKNTCERAGITNFRFHDLRHCYGSWLGMNSTNPKAMMELMGHRDPKMTMRYTHLSMDYKRQAVQKLPRFTAEVFDGPATTEAPRNPPSEVGGKVVRLRK